MQFTVTRHLAAAALLAISATASGSGSNQPPRFLTVPVIGLRVPVAGLKLDPFPDDLRATCRQIADDDLYIGRMWIFGRAKDSASTYYLLAGYFKRHAPDPERPLYEVSENGSVFIVRGTTCGGDDALETFDTPDANADNNGNVPIPVLRDLARDLAAQTVRAFGSPERLRTEVVNQRIDFDRLPQELQEAFAPYLVNRK